MEVINHEKEREREGQDLARDLREEEEDHLQEDPPLQELEQGATQGSLLQDYQRISTGMR